MNDPLPDPVRVIANWRAMSIFGREQESGRYPRMYTLNDIEISPRSYVLMKADIGWLMALFEANAQHG